MKKLPLVKSIIQIADIHIFLKKRHKEVYSQTQKLKQFIIDNKIELVCINGDIVDSKAKLSPEQFQTTSYFLSELASVCNLILIPGNHDLDLTQEGSLDSLTPIVDLLKGNTSFPIHYLKNSGIYNLFNINWCVWSCIDNLNPFEVEKVYDKDLYAIGLFHGAIKNCKTDSEWILTDSSIDIDTFENCDRVFLGDIHKFQTFRNDEIVYSGAGIYQCKIDEELPKGFCLWKYNETKQGYFFEFIPLYSEFGYHTYEVKDISTFDINSVKPYNENYIIRLLYTGKQQDFSNLNFTDLKKQIKSKFKNEVLLNKRFEKQYISKTKHEEKTTSLSKEEFFNKFYKNLSIDKETIVKLKDIDNKYNKLINNTEYEIGEYNILDVEISNFLCFGENNFINFKEYEGLLNIIGPNKIGKTTIFNAISFCLFNDCSKAKSSLKSLLNDQLDEEVSAFVQVRCLIRGSKWRIKRSLIPSKTSVKIKLEVFEEVSGIEVPRHVESRPKTDSEVLRKLLGNEEVFYTTVFCTATNINQFSNNQNSQRLDLLLKFLGISLYDQKLEIVTKENKEKELFKVAKLKSLSSLKTKETIDSLIEANNKEIKEIKKFNISLTSQIEESKKIVKILTENYLKLNVISIKQNKEELEKFLVKENNDLSSQENLLIVNNEKIKTALESWSKACKDNIETWESKLDLSSIQQIISNNTTEIKNLKKELESEICPTCNQVRKEINKEEIEEKIKSLTEENITLSKEVQEKTLLNNNLVKIQKDYKSINLELIQTKIELIQSKIESYNKDLQIIEDNKVKLESKVKLEEELEKEKEILSDLEIEINSNIRKESSLTLENTNLKKELLQYQTQKKEIEELEKETYLLDLYKKGVVRSGIPSLILQTHIPELNAEINAYLNDLFELNVEFKLEESNLDIWFYYDEFLKGDKGKRDISQASGMEGTILNLGIRAGLTKLCLLPKPSMLLLDEVFNTIDKTNLVLIQPLLNRLKEQYQNIILVSHLDELQSLADHKIELKKTEGVTEIV